MAPVGTPYSIDVANALDYVTDGGAKKLKIGIIYQNDEYGADGLRGFEAAKEALGFTDAGRQSYKPGDTDFTAQVQKLKAAGAEAVVVTALPSATGPIVGTAATLGFTPQWILQGPSYIEQLITKDGTTGAKPTPVAAALKGAIVTSFSAPWGDEDAPGHGAAARRPEAVRARPDAEHLLRARLLPGQGRRADPAQGDRSPATSAARASSPRRRTSARSTSAASRRP